MTKVRSELLSTARTGSGIIMINFLPMCEKGPSHDFYSAARLLFARVFKARRCVTAIDHFVRRNTYLTVVKCTRPSLLPWKIMRDLFCAPRLIFPSTDPVIYTVIHRLLRYSRFCRKTSNFAASGMNDGRRSLVRDIFDRNSACSFMLDDIIK